MLPEDERTREIIDSVNTPLILCGHTHVQGKIIHKGKCALNPGSVGVPLFSQGNTQFLILHNNIGVWSEEFISLSYEVEKFIRDMKEAKLYEHAPYWTIITENILRGNHVSHVKTLARAMEICRKETGSCKWTNIPESYWAKAVNEMLGEVLSKG